MQNLIALLEECLKNGDQGQAVLYAWFLGERDAIVSAIAEAAEASRRYRALFITPASLFDRIQPAAEWCQQTDYEFIKAGILDRLDEVEAFMAGWDEKEEL